MRLAQARRPEFQKLIKADPRRALAEAVPAEIVTHLERLVSARGAFNAYFGRPQPGTVLPPGQEPMMRYFETPEKSFKADVYGKVQEATSREGVALRGVAIERDMAVHESPVRRLESGERIAAGTPENDTCPVSGITTKIDDETPVVEVAGELIRRCDGSHVRVVEERENARMASGPGGAGFVDDAFPGTGCAAIGNFRCLYTRVTYPDQMSAPNTEAAAYSDMRNVSRFYLESSFGRMMTTSTVTPLVVLPHTQAWYLAKDSQVDVLGFMHGDAKAEALKLGYDSSLFTCTMARQDGDVATIWYIYWTRDEVRQSVPRSNA